MNEILSNALNTLGVSNDEALTAAINTLFETQKKRERGGSIRVEANMTIKMDGLPKLNNDSKVVADLVVKYNNGEVKYEEFELERVAPVGLIIGNSPYEVTPESIEKPSELLIALLNKKTITITDIAQSKGWLAKVDSNPDFVWKEQGWKAKPVTIMKKWTAA
jgi:hypothetical protein